MSTPRSGGRVGAVRISCALASHPRLHYHAHTPTSLSTRREKPLNFSLQLHQHFPCCPFSSREPEFPRLCRGNAAFAFWRFTPNLFTPALLYRSVVPVSASCLLRLVFIVPWPFWLSPRSAFAALRSLLLACSPDAPPFHRLLSLYQIIRSFCVKVNKNRTLQRLHAVGRGHHRQEGEKPEPRTNKLAHKAAADTLATPTHVG